MRFDQIQIPAFGPFTDFSLSFPATKSDLHLIYGPNEGGKSSLLRAIDNLLFGIPVRSKDNFLHESTSKLRIGATISDVNKGLLAFQRKKGNANTLLDAEGNSLPETVLTAFLGPVDRGFFGSMFGLDTASLREGANALVEGRGDLGSALFSASLGSTDIDAAIEKLESEANALFKGRSRVKIPNAVAVFKECEKQFKEATIKASVWKGHQKELHDAKEAFKQADHALAEADQRSRAIQRFLAAQPLTSRLAHAESCLAELAPIPELPGDFASKVRETQDRIDALNTNLKTVDHQRESFGQQLAALRTQPEILARAVDIEQLHQSIASHCERVRSLPDIVRECEDTSARLDQLLSQLSMSQEVLETLPPVSDDIVERVLRLQKSQDEEEQNQAQAESTLERLRKELESLDKDLSDKPVPGSASSLRALDIQVTKAESDRVRLDELTADWKKCVRDRDTHLARLGLEAMELAQVARLAVPSLDVIHEENSRLLQISNRLAKAEEQVGEIDRRLLEERAQLEELRNEGALYTRQDLLAKRQERDGYLMTVLDGSAADPFLRNVLPSSVREADEMADGLCRHAEQIALAEQHKNKIVELEGKRGLESTLLEKLQTERSAWQVAWEARWQELPTVGQLPQDRVDWVKGWSDGCEKIAECQALKDKIAEFHTGIEATHRKLALALNQPDEEFASLVITLRDRISSINKAMGAQETLEKRRGTLRDDVRQTTIKLEAAQRTRASYQAQLDPLLEPFPAPVEAVQTAQRLHSDLANQQQRIASQRSMIAEISQRVATLAPDDDRADAAAVDDRLWKSLAEAKDAAAQAKLLTKEIADIEAKRTIIDAELEAEHGKLDELQCLCGASAMPSLLAALATLEERARYRKVIDETKAALAGMTAGRPLDAFIAEATASSEEALLREQSDLENLLLERRDARDAARERLRSVMLADEEFQRASDAAASYQQRAQLHLSEIVTDSHRFMELQYAIEFLRRQIELYRDRTQAPMLQSTSNYFSILTNAAFDGVAAQLTDKGELCLVGVRDHGTFVATQAMSEGTADQLYLALRFAAIELHLAAHPAMPLVLDDLLITFDDERTTALLPILAKLSEKTQILVFTHHQHLLELFGKILPGAHTTHRM